jgi:Ca-activated chloride channel family protein
MGKYVLSAVGIGNGFDETVMSALADAGSGNFYYLPDTAKLSGVFADEFASARETIARSLAVVIAPAPGVAVASAGGYPLASEGGEVRFHPGDLFAGQERRIWLTLHVPTGALGDVALGEIAVEFATPEGERGRVPAALPRLACVAGEADYYASFDKDRYQRAERTDSIGALEQSVARKVAAGNQAEALKEIDTHISAKQVEQLRALGYALPDSSATLSELRSRASAPAAAAPDTRGAVGKSMFESGRDAQRAGAKK